MSKSLFLYSTFSSLDFLSEGSLYTCFPSYPPPPPPQLLPGFLPPWYKMCGFINNSKNNLQYNLPKRKEKKKNHIIIHKKIEIPNHEEEEHVHQFINITHKKSINFLTISSCANPPNRRCSKLANNHTAHFQLHLIHFYITSHSQIRYFLFLYSQSHHHTITQSEPHSNKSSTVDPFTCIPVPPTGSLISHFIIIIIVGRRPIGCIRSWRFSVR